MANWEKINERGNVEDRRGGTGTKNIGGISLTGIVLVLAVGYFGGADTALQLFDSLQQNQVVQEQSVDTSIFAGDDDYEVFTSKVLGSSNTLWGNAFRNSGMQYKEPRLVLFRGSTTSACGGAIAQAGPHYCPVDQTIYLDETFFEQLRQMFGAQGGDMAQAYVIAHEVAHHVQNLLGTIDNVNQAKRISTQAGNDASIKLELQADCFAGIWAASINQQGVMEKNEIYEAIDAAGAVGDDSIQKKTTGTVHPESWTHGSSAQRKERLGIGYSQSDFEACNTFG